MKNHHFIRRGFTLVELLVVILIVAALAALGFSISKKILISAGKVKCMTQIREITVGMSAYTADYQHPPIPEPKMNMGWDTIYGDPGGLYGTEFIVAALAGSEKIIQYPGESFDARHANPKGETYASFSIVSDNKQGVGREDGKLYDPWGREMMIAVNTGPYRRQVGNGIFDEQLMTWGLAEYTDTKPRYDSFVIWSYGKDGKKAKNLSGSDDVTSW